VLEISQPTFPIFPQQGRGSTRGGRTRYACIRERLRLELSNQAGTEERLRRLYLTMARDVEGDKKLWQAVVLSGAMDPVRSAEIARSRGGCRQFAARNSDARAEARRGDPSIPVVHLAEFMEGLYNTVVRNGPVRC